MCGGAGVSGGASEVWGGLGSQEGLLRCWGRGWGLGRGPCGVGGGLRIGPQDVGGSWGGGRGAGLQRGRAVSGQGAVRAAAESRAARRRRRVQGRAVPDCARCRSKEPGSCRVQQGSWIGGEIRGDGICVLGGCKDLSGQKSVAACVSAILTQGLEGGSLSRVQRRAARVLSALEGRPDSRHQAYYI